MNNINWKQGEPHLEPMELQELAEDQRSAMIDVVKADYYAEKASIDEAIGENISEDVAKLMLAIWKLRKQHASKPFSAVEDQLCMQLGKTIFNDADAYIESLAVTDVDEGN